ncbi:MAG: DUF4430 domain-containing protein [Lachnospiraceae bacterium]|nr:DUF4430 domain-containing protein [Lachnospiraceae bacterium]
MKIMSSKKIVSGFLCMMLIAVMIFACVGCSTNQQNAEGQAVAQTQESEKTVLGEGSKVFDFIVVDKDGAEACFEIHTDAEVVGDALLALDLISGDVGEYGLYVKSVNGITADYDVDQTYWAFYVNGEYATAGVDTTVIEEGTTYSFKVEK